MKTKNILISVLITVMLLLIACEPVIAVDIYETTTTTTAFRLQYDDGTYGDVNVTTLNNTFDSWADSMNITNPETGVVMEVNFGYGVQMGAIYENEANVMTTTAASVPANYECYMWGWDGEAETVGTDYTTIEDVIPILQFYVQVSNRDIMNGAQQMWYRSPLKWNSDTYQMSDTWGPSTDVDTPHHFLNIFDSDGNLVCADRAYYLEDNRSYFRLNFKFFSDEKYRFVEYIQTVDDNPIDSVNLFFANYQDIASDEYAHSYIFPGTDYARILSYMELSWGIAFELGIGAAGTERLLPFNDLKEDSHYFIRSQILNGTVDDVDSLNITVPFRFTHPTNVTVAIVTDSDGSIATDEEIYEGVTGILDVCIEINDPDAGAPNQYVIYFLLENDGTADKYATYTMIPTEGYVHYVCTYNETGLGIYVNPIATNHFAIHLELEEREVAETVDSSIRDPFILVGIAFILAGILVTVFALVTGNIPLAVVGAGLIVAGAFSIIYGATGITPVDLIGMVVEGSINLLKYIYDGLVWIGENLWDAWIWIVESVKAFGMGLYNAIAIFIDFLFLVAFLCVVWIWAKFLKIMTGIVEGDIDKALATTTEFIRTRPFKYALKKKGWSYKKPKRPNGGKK